MFHLSRKKNFWAKPKLFETRNALNWQKLFLHFWNFSDFVLSFSNKKLRNRKRHTTRRRKRRRDKHLKRKIFLLVGSNFISCDVKGREELATSNPGTFSTQVQILTDAFGVKMPSVDEYSPVIKPRTALPTEPQPVALFVFDIFDKDHLLVRQSTDYQFWTPDSKIRVWQFALQNPQFFSI